MKRTFKAIRAAGIALCLTAAMLACGTAAFADEGDVTYLDQEGQTQTLKVDDYTAVGGGASSLGSGWYVVKDSIETKERVEVSGDVKLILTDGARWNCQKGVHVPGGSELTVYGQNTDPKKAGRLIAEGYTENAGIGGNDDSKADSAGNCGSLNFYGGWIEAIGAGYAAGIGTGDEPNTSSPAAAYQPQYYINIGGSAKVIANAGWEGAGIGSGNEGKGSRGKITISGNADVTANGGKYGAGIGGGDQTANTDITIESGTVNATGGFCGPGIGCGDDCKAAGGGVSIWGGKVNAIGGAYGAGIGAGDTGNMNFVLNITGGQITAKGGPQGAGIGGGNHTIWSGGGDGGDVIVNIKKDDYDSFVHAVAGNSDSSAIGHGDGGEDCGTLDIGPGNLVKADLQNGKTGRQDLEPLEPALLSDRAWTCQTAMAVLIERCQHNPGVKYSYIDENYHRLMCCHCNYIEEQNHTADPEEPCAKCNYRGETWSITLKEGASSRYTSRIKVARGHDAVLPECDGQRIPKGRVFAGWASEEVMDQISGIDIDAPADEAEIMKVTKAIRDCRRPGATITPEKDLSYTAIYVKNVTLEFKPGKGARGSVQSVDVPMYTQAQLPKRTEFDVPTTMMLTGWKEDGTGTDYKPGANYSVERDTVSFTAKWEEHVHQMQAHKAAQPTCENYGNIPYWECSICEKFFRDEAGEIEIEEGDTYIYPAGHFWGDPVYTWSEDNSTVTASRTCLRDGNHVETETAQTSFYDEVPATCSQEGKRFYVVQFDKSCFTIQTKKVDTPRQPHSWGEWIPKEGQEDILIRTCPVCGSTAEKPAVHEHTMQPVPAVEPTCLDSGMKAYWVCKDPECGNYYADEQGDQLLGGKDELSDVEAMLRVPAKGHKLGAPVVSEIKESTCDEEGVVRVTYSCEHEGCEFYKEEEPNTPALGHDWGEPVYEWSEDNSQVTATSICKRDPEHEDPEHDVLTETVRTTSETVTEVTRTKDGEELFTATFENKAFRKQTKTEIVPATGGPEVAAAASEAEDLIFAAQAINSKAWSVKSYAAVTKAVQALEKVLKDDSCTAAQIKAASQTLQKAMNSLKKDQKLTVKAKKKVIKVKAKKLKKKAKSFKALTVTGQKTKVSYKGVGVNKKSKKALKINVKTGKIKVKKKTKKGTYKMRVTVTAAGSAKYEPAKRTVTVVVKVR